MLLSLQDVRKTFGGLAAVDGASLSVGSGEVHGLIGPNGAGKTTLLNMISGLIPPTAGTIVLDGERIDGMPSHVVASRGITRTYQNIRLFPALTAADNVLVGAHLRRDAPLWRRMLFLPSAAVEERAAQDASLALLARVGMSGQAGERASNLSYGDQRRVEIARALASEPRVMLLDEPTAGMNPAEVVAIAELIRSVARTGHSVLLVEHNVKLVMDVCDRITVLDFGKVIADGTPTEVARDPAVIAAYLGGEAAA